MEYYGGRNRISAIPRIQLDACAALCRWHQCGAQIVRITEKQEMAMLAETLPPALSMLTDLPVQALGIQLAEREDWIVIARLPAELPVQVYGPQCWAYRQPVLLYLTEIGTAIAAGYLNLHDQPTIADLSLRPGKHLMDGPRQLGEADIAGEDYRLALAIHRLYSPAK